MKKRTICTAILMFWLLIPSIVMAGQLVSDVEDILQERINALNISNLKIDLNTRITIPAREEMPSVDLFATVIRHEGKQLPTITIITPYRREQMIVLYLSLLSHDYNLLAVDVRGTGSSNGDWVSFDPQEHMDAAYIIDEFIPSQFWSDGRVGTIGPSYMGISQLLAAGHLKTDASGYPIHLKALFPLVTMSDVFGDVALQGGNFNLEFIVAWLGGIDLLGILPPLIGLGEEKPFYPSLEDIQEAVEIWQEHLANIPVTIGWIMDEDNLRKNSFYDARSAMLYWPDKPEGGWVFDDTYPEGLGTTVISEKLPTFLTGGWFDLFTRGTLNYYRYGLKNHDTSDKALIIGPWYHIDGSLGLGINALMLGDLPARWFNWKIKGLFDPFMNDFPVVLYVMGENRWRAEKSWPLPESRLENRHYYLSKKKASLIMGDWFGIANAINNYKLVKSIDNSDYYTKFLWFNIPRINPVLVHRPEILHGMISRSSTRWIAGVPAFVTQASKALLNKDIDKYMPWEDERLDELGVLTFTSETLSEDIEIVGPLTLRFWAKSKFNRPLAQASIDIIIAMIEGITNTDSNTFLELINTKSVQWIVELNDVFPNGRARNITSGWQSAHCRPYDESNPLEIDPEYTPFDPFYDRPFRSPDLISEDQVYPYIIELWPTDNIFKKGHRIRISISASDFPHFLPFLRPSINTIVLDEDHRARLDFQICNNEDENITWKWIDNINGYLLNHSN